MFFPIRSAIFLGVASAVAIVGPIAMVGSVALLGGTSAYAQDKQMSDCASKAIASGNAVANINSLGRAKNLARQSAEAANGGLMNYRADASMHGRISDAPCVDNGNGTWTFTVKGGAPGFTTPTQETVVTVDANTGATKIDYNGPIR